MATGTQNLGNQLPQTRVKTSKWKGVCWDKQRAKWAAKIQRKDVGTVFLGRFKDEVDAAKAYNKAAREYFGEFAYLNVISKE